MRAGNSEPVLMNRKKNNLFGAPLLILAAGALLLCTSCRQHPSSYYLLEGGNPEVDYLELLGDTACRYMVPGGIEVVTPCHVDAQKGTIGVDVAGFVKGYLWYVSPDTLQGSAPFFEGIWVRK